MPFNGLLDACERWPCDLHPPSSQDGARQAASMIQQLAELVLESLQVGLASAGGINGETPYALSAWTSRRSRDLIIFRPVCIPHLIDDRPECFCFLLQLQDIFVLSFDVLNEFGQRNGEGPGGGGNGQDTRCRTSLARAHISSRRRSSCGIDGRSCAVIVPVASILAVLPSSRSLGGDVLGATDRPKFQAGGSGGVPRRSWGHSGLCCLNYNRTFSRCLCNGWRRLTPAEYMRITLVAKDQEPHHRSANEAAGSCATSSSWSKLPEAAMDGTRLCVIGGPYYFSRMRLALGSALPNNNVGWARLGWR